MAIDRNVDELKPCPICNKKDQLYIGYSQSSEYKHITCIRCEIDTWSRMSRESIAKWWNELPRREDDQES